MCPGECIVYDRGEFCNSIMEILNKNFKAKIRVTSAGRPQANGQAESKVKSMKTKMYALMVEGGHESIPDNWDETLLPRALQILRSDPSSATGFSPIELLIGRKPVWPIELCKADIDFSGTELTMPLVAELDRIHNAAFGVASANIKREQERYCRAYDKKHGCNPLKLRVGMKVQIF